MVAWNALTEDTAHRPWPLPSRPWVVTMSWVDLLFAHWRCEPAVLAALLPAGLALDTFEGQAFLGVVPFRMEHVGPRGLGWLPGRLPGPRSFAELNVRTYVVRDGKPGVWFLSLDAVDRLAVWGARTAFHLPYVNARIVAQEQDGWISYASRRTDRRMGPGELTVRYRGVGDRLRAEPGSLEHWLTERYCLYAIDRRGRRAGGAPAGRRAGGAPEGQIRRGEIHHATWPLRLAEVDVTTNTVAEAHGLRLDGQPELAHFVRRIDVVAWWLD